MKITVSGTITGTAPFKLHVYIIQIDPNTMVEIGGHIDDVYVTSPGATWSTTVQGPNLPSGTSKSYKTKALGEDSNGNPTGDSASVNISITVSGGPC